MNRVLWVGKPPGDGDAGDEIWDRQIIRHLRAMGVQIDAIHPRRVSRAGELLNLIRGTPYYRARYQSWHNVKRLAQAARGYDLAIVSWEPFDMLALGLPIPCVVVLHNITSAALRSIDRGNPLTAAFARRAARWERQAYASARFAAIACVSRADAAYVRTIVPAATVVFAPPGLPAGRPLRRPVFRREIVLAGTFDWKPKRRDLMAFARSYAAAALPWPVYADGLPEEAARLLRPRPLSDIDFSDAVRVGVVTDRFVAGQKLKTGYYLANNCVVASFAEVQEEYKLGGLNLIEQVKSPAALAAFIERVGNAGMAVVTEQQRIKAQFAENMSWERSAGEIFAQIDGFFAGRRGHVAYVAEAIA